MGDGDITISAREVFDTLRALERRFDRQDAKLIQRFDRQDAQLTTLQSGQKTMSDAFGKHVTNTEERLEKAESRINKIESWRTAVLAVWAFLVAVGTVVLGVLRPHFG